MAAGDTPGPYQPVFQAPIFTGTAGERYDGPFNNLTDARDFANDLQGGRVNPILGAGWTRINIIRDSSGKGWYVETDFVRPGVGDEYDLTQLSETEDEEYPADPPPPPVTEPPPGQPPAPPGEPPPPGGPTAPMSWAPHLQQIAERIEAEQQAARVGAATVRRPWSVRELDLSALRDGEVATSYERISSVWCGCNATRGWSAVAQRCSALNGGQWIPRPNGMTYVCGSRRAWFTQWSGVPAVCDALDAVAKLGLKAGPSIGSCARVMLRWISEPQLEDRAVERVMNDAAFGYHDCQPGTYEHGVLYDLSRAYFSLWCRLPSLRCHLTRDGRLVWFRFSAEEERRRRTVEAACAPQKTLRNSLYGVSLGGIHGLRYYRDGELCIGPVLRGPYRPAGLVIARLAWELTRDASELTSSVYSHTDSVLSAWGEYPQIWEDWGLDVSEKCAGPAEVVSRGVYAVGPHTSALYRLGDRQPFPVERGARPARSYVAEVLDAA